MEKSEIFQALNSEDSIGKVLRAHLCIESLVNDFLQHSLLNSQYLKPISLDYFGKVYLCLATGLNQDFKNPLLQIGNIRNNLAHVKNAQIDKNKVNNLYKSFSQTQIDEIFSMSKKSGHEWAKKNNKWSSVSVEEKFTILVISLYYLLELEIHDFDTANMVKKYHLTAGEISLKKHMVDKNV